LKFADGQSPPLTARCHNNTIVVFEAVAESVNANVDHLESNNCFSEENLQHNCMSERKVWNAVRQDVSVDRHQGTAANYLYADSHVTAIAADAVGQWRHEGHNFAIPPK
jgi:prepilin-type processing-associated H-X9-DG protein